VKNIVFITVQNASTVGPVGNGEGKERGGKRGKEKGEEEEEKRRERGGKNL
jgi:hypothetical protein